MRELFRRLSSHPVLAGEILAATLMTTLFNLAMPIYVMQILNRYVSYGFHGTLITLTVGMLIAICMQFCFRPAQEQDGRGGEPGIQRPALPGDAHPDLPGQSRPPVPDLKAKNPRGPHPCPGHPAKLRGPDPDQPPGCPLFPDSHRIHLPAQPDSGSHFSYGHRCCRLIGLADHPPLQKNRGPDESGDFRTPGTELFRRQQPGNCPGLLCGSLFELKNGRPSSRTALA